MVRVGLQTAATCRGKSYAAPSASLPHTGFSFKDIVPKITNKKLKRRISESKPDLPAVLSPATVNEVNERR